MDPLKFVGFPLNIWIHKNDNLLDIIHKYIRKDTRSFIMYCYRVKNDDKQKKIAIQIYLDGIDI